MNKRVFLGAMVVALAVVLSVGVIVASNMGFKANKQLLGLGAGATQSKFGNNYISVPYFPQTGMANAKDLGTDIGCANVNTLQRYIESTNLFQVYNCRSSATGINFPLVPGESSLIVARAVPNFTYLIVGSHNPNQGVNIDGTPGSKFGNNYMAPPFHFTGSNAKDLGTDIGCASVSTVQRYVESTNLFQVYNCRSSATGINFAVAPGEGYLVVARPGAVVYTPSHY